MNDSPVSLRAPSALVDAVGATAQHYQVSSGEFWRAGAAALLRLSLLHLIDADPDVIRREDPDADLETLREETQASLDSLLARTFAQPERPGLLDHFSLN